MECIQTNEYSWELFSKQFGLIGTLYDVYKHKRWEFQTTYDIDLDNNIFIQYGEEDEYDNKYYKTDEKDLMKIIEEQWRELIIKEYKNINK